MGPFLRCQKKPVDFRMPADMKSDALRKFLYWVESGRIVNEMGLEELWAFGNVIGSPDFCNEIMHKIFARSASGSVYLTAKKMETSYALTLPGSILREYMKQMVLTEGPLLIPFRQIATNRDAPYWLEQIDDWARVVGRRGDLISDICIRECATLHEPKAPPEKRPWWWSRQHMYLKSRWISMDDFIRATES